LKYPQVNDRLKIQANVMKVDSRRATFDVSITDENNGEVVAIGVNGRAVIADSNI
jgi:acyl-coenzyme A thioesterase PaaI-like protein